MLAQIEIEDEVKECLPLKILETFDTVRNNFLSQIDKLRKSKINLTQAKGLGLIHNNPVVFPTKRVPLKMWSTSIKIYIDVKHILGKFKEQGIVNKKCRPICCKKICSQEDYRIINQVATIAYALMHFYSCADNL